MGRTIRWAACVGYVISCASLLGCSDGAPASGSPLDAASPQDLVTVEDASTTDAPDVESPDVGSPDVVNTDVGSPDAGCHGGTTGCDGRCVSLRSDNEHCGACGNACPQGQVCTLGTCGCPAPLTGCAEGAGTRCVDRATDSRNCGGCGVVCGAGQRCEASRCVASCGAGLSECGGQCVDTRSDPAQCGACGRACPTTPNRPAVCVAGVCTQGACAAGFADCDNDYANGCEVELARSAAHCGRCGNACPAGRFGAVACVMGACATTCDAGYADCDADAANGCEVDTNNDPHHCGGCGRACPSGQGCQRGACQSGTACSIMAAINCVGWGGSVVETSPGSGRVICTRNGRPGTDFCNASCDNYRIFAWRAGARPAVCATQTADTVAGGSYTGPVTCGCDQPLRRCGSWDMSTCVSD